MQRNIIEWIYQLKSFNADYNRQMYAREMRISVCQCQYQYQLADAKRTRCIVNYPVNYDRPN